MTVVVMIIGTAITRPTIHMQKIQRDDPDEIRDCSFSYGSTQVDLFPVVNHHRYRSEGILFGILYHVILGTMNLNSAMMMIVVWTGRGGMWVRFAALRWLREWVLCLQLIL